MATITIKKYDMGFTPVLNELLYNKDISLIAKGLYAYLFSKPDGWEFHLSSMQKELKESAERIRNAIKELINYGYIIRRQENKGGVFGGMIYEFLDKSRICEKPHTEKTVYGKIPTHSNTDINSNTYIKKEIYKESFENFWSIYPKQRAGSKQKAYQSFCKAIKEKRATEEILLSAVRVYAQSEEVKRGFAKGCAAWLNDDRFNNNYGEIKKSFSEMTDAEKMACLRN